MRILHTSDWHIGCKSDDLSRIDEQYGLCKQIIKIANDYKVDMVVIAGDIYSMFIPSAEAEKLVFDTLIALSDNGNRAVVAVAGNHDDPKRLTNENVFSKHFHIYLAGDLQKIDICKLPDKNITAVKSGAGYIEFKSKTGERACVGLLPYPSYYRFNEIKKAGENFDSKIKQWLEPCTSHFSKDSVNLLVSHLLTYPVNCTPDDFESYESVSGIIPFVDRKNLIAAGADYTALGHLHQDITIDKKHHIYYSSAPINMFFNDDVQYNNIVKIVDLKAGVGVTNIENVPLETKKLETQTVSSYEEARNFLKVNPNILIKLNFNNMDFVDPNKIKELRQQFPNLITVAVVPKSINKSYSKITKKDLSTKEIFVKFVENKTGKKPERELTELFLELMGEITYETN